MIFRFGSLCNLDKQLDKFVQKCTLLLDDINIEKHREISTVQSIFDILKIFTNVDINHNVSPKSIICMYRQVSGMFNHDIKFAFCELLLDNENNVYYLNELISFHSDSCYVGNNRNQSKFETFLFLTYFYKYLKRTKKNTKLDFSQQYFCSDQSIKTKNVYDINIDIAKFCKKMYNIINKQKLQNKSNELKLLVSDIQKQIVSDNDFNEIEKKKKQFKILHANLSNKTNTNVNKKIIQDYSTLKREITDYEKINAQNMENTYKITKLNNELDTVNKKIHFLQVFNIKNRF